LGQVGPNSAVIHYKPVPGSDSLLTLEHMYLLDTGGQYLDGTTDVTRTFHFGAATAEQKRAYTRVLQGHLALARAVFPSGTPGLMLDALARAPLWQDGLTYGHGTGHGIGAYLNVHEGPFGIGGGTVAGGVIRQNPRMLAYYLEPIELGMYVSDEPGFYLAKHWGVRLESDLVVVEAGKFGGGSGGGGGDGEDEDPASPSASAAFSSTQSKPTRPFLKFDYVTKVPMCLALIDVGLLSPPEVEWIDGYHRDCAECLLPLLAGDAGAREWLRQATVPLKSKT